MSAESSVSLDLLPSVDASLIALRVETYVRPVCPYSIGPAKPGKPEKPEEPDSPSSSPPSPGPSPFLL